MLRHLSSRELQVRTKVSLLDQMMAWQSVRMMEWQMDQTMGLRLVRTRAKPLVDVQSRALPPRSGQYHLLAEEESSLCARSSLEQQGPQDCTAWGRSFVAPVSVRHEQATLEAMPRKPASDVASNRQLKLHLEAVLLCPYWSRGTLLGSLGSAPLGSWAARGPGETPTEVHQSGLALAGAAIDRCVRIDMHLHLSKSICPACAV